MEEALKMVERGFRILKVKVGRPDPAEDVEMVAALRRAVGSEIKLHVHRAFPSMPNTNN